MKQEMLVPGVSFVCSIQRPRLRRDSIVSAEYMRARRADEREAKMRRGAEFEYRPKEFQTVRERLGFSLDDI